MERGRPGRPDRTPLPSEETGSGPAAHGVALAGVEDILHGIHEVGIRLRRNAPAPDHPGLETGVVPVSAILENKHKSRTCHVLQLLFRAAGPAPNQNLQIDPDISVFPVILCAEFGRFASVICLLVQMDIDS